MRTGRHAEFARQLLDLALRILGGEAHRCPHVESRTRTERTHVVGRDIGIGMDDMYRRSIDVEHLGRNLRHHSVRALAHVDRADIKSAASVAVKIDDRNRGRRRSDTLETDRNAASAPNVAGAAVER